VSREDGFLIANIDIQLLDDYKLKLLRRELGVDAVLYAIALYLALVLESWGHGKRVTIEEAAPDWIELRPDVISAMQRVKLVDRSRRIPAETWEGWYGPAYRRREGLRRGGKKGGQAKAQARLKPSSSLAQARQSDRRLEKPSNGEERRGETTHARERPRGEDPVKFDEAMKRSGFTPRKKH
jgi:hypothetical protein